MIRQGGDVMAFFSVLTALVWLSVHVKGVSFLARR